MSLLPASKFAVSVSDGLNADRVWITNWHPSKNADGTVVGIYVVAEDITERKHAEGVMAASQKALRDSDLRFRELADHISQFAWTADPMAGSMVQQTLARLHRHHSRGDAGVGLAQGSPSPSR